MDKFNWEERVIQIVTKRGIKAAQTIDELVGLIEEARIEERNKTIREIYDEIFSDHGIYDREELMDYFGSLLKEEGSK